MQIPEWTQPALIGAAAGAVVLAIVGFNWGGWMTTSSANTLSSNSADAAVAAVLTPYCLRSSTTDPEAAAILAELEAASGYQRRGIVEKAGWATPLGAERPNRDLAEACQIALSKNT